jgi:lysine-specific demethylase/histidyl-hydroxylase NO66
MEVDDFEGLASSVTSPLDEWISIVRGHASRPTTAMLTDDGCADLSDLLSAYSDERATLLLTRVHKQKMTVAKLCSQLKRSIIGLGFPLRSRIGVNAYLTPPRAAGVSRHYDDRCVLVVQLSGEKSWLILTLTPEDPFPLPGHGSSRSHSDTKLEFEYRVKPGDVLYVPRGHLHEARANEQASLHPALSICLYTWRDLLQELIDGVEQFRMSIPPKLFRGAGLGK